MKDCIIFPEGKKEINKNDIKSLCSVVVLPHSVDAIEEKVFYGMGCTILYVGTKDEFERIINSHDIGVPSVECVDGSKMLQL